MRGMREMKGQGDREKLLLPITHYPLLITHYSLPITQSPMPHAQSPLPITLTKESYQ